MREFLGNMALAGLILFAVTAFFVTWTDRGPKT